MLDRVVMSRLTVGSSKLNNFGGAINYADKLRTITSQEYYQDRRISFLTPRIKKAQLRRGAGNLSKQTKNISEKVLIGLMGLVYNFINSQTSLAYFNSLSAAFSKLLLSDGLTAIDRVFNMVSNFILAYDASFGIMKRIIDRHKRKKKVRVTDHDDNESVEEDESSASDKNKHDATSNDDEMIHLIIMDKDLLLKYIADHLSHQLMASITEKQTMQQNGERHKQVNKNHQQNRNRLKYETNQLHHEQIKQNKHRDNWTPSHSLKRHRYYN